MIPTIIDAMRREDIFKPLFRDLKTWENWMTFLRSFFALKFEKGKEFDLYKECTRREVRSEKPFQEAYAIVGRRGGKSYIAALIASYLALCGKDLYNWDKHLAPREKAHIFVIATDVQQARIILDYIKGMLVDLPGLVEAELKWQLRLTNNINVEVRTASYRAGRGYTTACILLDEIAFMRDENSANPCAEIINSLLPGLLPNGILMGLSTPYGKFGYLWNVYKEFYGKDESEILVWKAPTKVMNPGYKDSLIQRMFKRDRSAARTEYDAEFREDLESFIPEALYDRCVKEGTIMKLRERGQRYFAFVDSSGGRKDSYTLAIAHMEGNIVILDRIEETKPEFDPAEVTKDYSEIITSYGISQVVGDRYGGNWCPGSFKKSGLHYELAPFKASELYLEFLALANMGFVELLDNVRLKNQFLSLERRTKRGGQDAVDHPRGLHDDMANAVAGVSVIAYLRVRRKLTEEEMEIKMPRRTGEGGENLEQYANDAIFRAAREGRRIPIWAVRMRDREHQKKKYGQTLENIEKAKENKEEEEE